MQGRAGQGSGFRPGRCRAVSLAFLLALASAPVPAGVALPTAERVRILEPARPVGDFELTGQDGQPFRFASLAGRPVLVAFGFTSCPDICPTILGNLKMLRSVHGEALAETAVVFISVDGARDTPERLAAFLGHYSPEFIGLTGTSDEVQRVASRFRAVFYPERPNPATGHYNVAHSVQVFAVDRRGRLRAEYHNASLDAMATVTRALVSESP